MRFLLSLFLGLAALSTPCAAVSATSTLARLTARLAAAEQTLAQLTTQTSEPTVSGWYNFDGGLWEDINGGNRATVFPDKAGNVALQSDNARGQVVFTRSASNTLAASYVSLPVGLNAPAFSLSTWISWGGFNQAGVNQATAISAANDNLLVTVGTTGALTVKVGTGTITGLTLPDDGSWTHITIVYNGASLALYRNGQPFSSVAAGGFPGSNTISLANNAARTAGYVGGLDDVQIYSSAMEDFEVNLAYDETRSKTTGFSSINDGWWGHYSQAKVVFANRVASQATGDIKFIGSFNDAELRPTNRIYVRLYGVTGTSTTTAGVVVNANNVDRVWWDNATMMLKIQTKVVFGQGQTFEFTIPASALNLINPASPNAASSSDSRWIVAVALDQDQTGNKRQGLRYQGCFNTPATIVPNPSL